MFDPDKIDELIRSCDPGGHNPESEQDNVVLRESQSTWSKLSRRRIIRKRMAAGFAAAACIGLVCTGVYHSERLGLSSQSQIAKNQNDPSQTEPPSADSIGAISSGSDRPNQEAESDGANESHPEIHSTMKDAEFASFIEFVVGAGEPGSDDWKQTLHKLASSDVSTQRLAIDSVAKLDNESVRRSAFQLVYQAAGNSKRTVLNHWLSAPSLRDLAWEHLVGDCNGQEIFQLSPLASNESERSSICLKLIELDQDATPDILVRLVQDSDWRRPVRLAAEKLSKRHLNSLILRMRQRDLQTRTAAAFILASVPGDFVDRAVAEMILGRRYQQPAYLVLLSRNTPQARAFLARVSARPDLNAALVSARAHFVPIQPQLQQWISDSQGQTHEPIDTTNRPSFGIDVPHRLVHLGRVKQPVG